MRYIVRVLCTTLVLSLPLLGQGQNHYVWNPTVTLVDNTAWCVTHNCLTSISLGGVSEIKAGNDGTVYNLTTSTHTVSTYKRGTGWVQAASALQTAGGYTIKHISVGSSYRVLALSSAAWPNNNVYVLNSAGTAWQPLSQSAWFTMAEIGGDGTIWGINLSYASAYYWTGSAWVTVAGQSNIAVGSAPYVWGVSSSGVLSSWNGSAWLAISPVPSFTPSHEENAIAAVGETALAVIDTTGKIHVSANSGQTWSTIMGTAAAIAGGGPMTFVNNSSGRNYHVNLLVPQLYVAASGYWDCGGGCPPNSTHTLTAVAAYRGLGGAHGTAGVTGSSAGAPAAQLSSTATETGVNCDQIFGATNDPSCTTGTIGGVVCSQMGVIGGGGGYIYVLADDAITGSVWDGTGYELGSGRSNVTYCGAVNNCTAATTPPLCNAGSPVNVYNPMALEPHDVCSGRAGWLQVIPYETVWVNGVLISTLCEPFFGTATPEYDSAPLTCTQ